MNVKNCKQFQQKWFGFNQKGHGRCSDLYSVVSILLVASSKILSSSCAKAHSVGTQSSKATPLCSHVWRTARSNSSLISGRIRISDGLAVCVISLRHLFASWRILKWTNELFDQLYWVPVVKVYSVQGLTFSNSTFCPHSVFVFFVDMRTNSDYFPVQHWLTDFYNREDECLLRGTGLIRI